MSTNTSMRVTT